MFYKEKKKNSIFKLGEKQKMRIHSNKRDEKYQDSII